MSDYQFEMPFPPSVNGYWRTFQNRQIISKRGREYRIAAIASISAQGLSGEKLSGRLSVYVRMHPPTRARRDLDNYLKAALDAISHSEFWIDDEQIDKLTICRAEIIKEGKLVITVRGMDSE